MEEFELEPGETIVMALRKHPLVFAVELLPYVVFFFLPVVLMIFIAGLAGTTPALATVSSNLSLGNSWVRLLLGTWWLMVWTGAFNAFTRYYLDQWIITSTRIVDIHQYGFFSRGVSSFLLSHVQDVTTNVDGPLATFFGFGTLRVETAGDASQHFMMTGIPNPESVRDLIMREVAAFNPTTSNTV